MLTHEYEATILVNGKPVTEIAHQGNSYIEGRKNSAYELRFHNKTNRRVEIVPSVDGLSVLDGKACGISSTGYVVEAYQNITIPGWRVDGTTAAKFIFKPQGANDSSGDQTYAEAMGQSPANQGIIGFMVFPEKPRPVALWAPNCWGTPYYDPYHGGHGGAVLGVKDLGTFYSGSVLRSSNAVPPGGSASAGGTPKNVTPTSSMSARSRTIHGSGGAPSAMNMTMNAVSLDSVASQASQCMDAFAQQSMVEDASLGTGFGKATQFNTTTVNFDREHATMPSVVMTIYYDTLRGLKRIGVPVERLQKSYKPKPTPNAFPASPHLTTGGCTLPKGWKKV